MSHLLARSGLLLSCFASSTNETDDGDDGQGFLKVHGSLTALITHHSIMPELLPVTLNIHRHNPSFSDTDPDYASLQDFTQLMKDMKLGRQKSDHGEEEEDAYQ